MEYLYFPLELLTALAVYSIGLEKRENFGLRFAAVFVAVTGFLVGPWMLAFRLYDQSTDIAVSNIVISITSVFLGIVLIMAIVIWILFKVSFREAAYCITCTYLTEHIAYCIRLLVNGFTGTHSADSGRILYFFIHAIVYLTAYFIFANRIMHEGHYVTSALQSAGLMVSVLFLVLLMSMVASQYGFETIHGIYALFCCIFVLYGQIKQQKELNLQKELSAQEQLWMRSRAQYEMSKETIDIINRKCHDLKHQLSALKTIDNLEKRGEVIGTIEDSVMIYDSMLKTGNAILDTVLTEKSLLCNQEKISMTCIADGKILDFMDAVDLYTLFGNALDNAIEAVRELPTEERAINLLLHKKAGLIFIQVENRYQGTLKMENGIPITQKEDKNYHGFGLHSIMHIAEKYRGFVTLETEGQIFLLRLTIPQASLPAPSSYDTKPTT